MRDLVQEVENMFVFSGDATGIHFNATEVP